MVHENLFGLLGIPMSTIHSVGCKPTQKLMKSYQGATFALAAIKLLDIARHVI